MTRTDSHSVAVPPNVDDALAVARQQLRGMRYGIVQIVVHDGQVVQIERTERTRLSAAGVRPGTTVPGSDDASASAHHSTGL